MIGSAHQRQGGGGMQWVSSPYSKSYNLKSFNILTFISKLGKTKAYSCLNVITHFIDSQILNY